MKRVLIVTATLTVWVAIAYATLLFVPIRINQQLEAAVKPAVTAMIAADWDPSVVASYFTHESADKVAREVSASQDELRGLTLQDCSANQFEAIGISGSQLYIDGYVACTSRESRVVFAVRIIRYGGNWKILHMQKLDY